MEKKHRQASIFIVYRGAETALAEALQSLLEGWGYRAFYSGEPVSNRDPEEFRRELRDRIRKFDLVILLLSREFRWSAYCQAEAGTTMALEKPFIPLLVPPVTTRDMWDEVAPVLSGITPLNIDDPLFVSRLQEMIVSGLAKSRESLRQIIATLRELETAGLPAPVSVRLEVQKKESERQAALQSAVDTIKTRYRLAPPKEKLIRAWRSMEDEACKASIVGNIVRHLKLPGQTDLTFVGVSLKFSLRFIEDALRKLVDAQHGKLLLQKRLKINLIHMDDQAHILHALKDTRDMAAIKLRFGVNWQGKLHSWKELWKKVCGDNVELDDPNLYRIDYIPPRVGVLMETAGESTLYAGRCAFNQDDLDLAVFELYVGENEYLYYDFGPQQWGAEDPKPLREFKFSMNAYRDPRHNSGATPIWGSGDWLSRLEGYIEEIHGTTEVTLISGTGKRFEGLVRKAITHGAKVTSYVCDTESHLPHAKRLFDDLFRELGEAAKSVEIRRYTHPATFRGVVIGDTAIGLQVYVKPDDLPGPSLLLAPMECVKKLPICLIITPCFEHFRELKKHVLEFAKGDPAASEVLSFNQS
jgi:hypothetical protein